MAGGCLFGAWVYIRYAIAAQSPDDYWIGIAFLGEAWGLLRRLNWARGFGLLGLALVLAWSLWLQSTGGATVGSALCLAFGLLAAWMLARHPQYFTRRWW